MKFEAQYMQSSPALWLSVGLNAILGALLLTSHFQQQLDTSAPRHGRLLAQNKGHHHAGKEAAAAAAVTGTALKLVEKVGDLKKEKSFDQGSRCNVLLGESGRFPPAAYKNLATNNHMARCVEAIAQRDAVQGCTSHLECSLSAPMRTLYRATLASGAPGLAAATALQRSLDAANDANDAGSGHGGGGARPPRFELLAPVIKGMPNASTPLSPPRARPAWPARREASAVDWSLLPEGRLFKGGTDSGCSLRGAHWFCGHFQETYFDEWDQRIDKCYEPAGVFAPPDLRLILDVGGATGGFAAAVHRKLGDRVVVTTANFWLSVDHGHYAPMSEYLAQRGFPTVMLDQYAVLPFGDSTLDMVHSSWAFHDGIPRATLYEIHRVLRPGGWLVLRSTDGSVLEGMRQFAREARWTIEAESRTPACSGRLTVVRMPTPFLE